MVQQQAASRFGLPLSLFTYDNALTTQLNTASTRRSATGQLLAPNSVTFRYAHDGLDVVKTFTFDSSYVDRRARRGKAQWLAGPRACRMARRPRRYGGVPCRQRQAHHVPCAHSVAACLVD